MVRDGLDQKNKKYIDSVYKIILCNYIIDKMSYNRLIYDECAYRKTLDESVGPLGYILNPMKYENCQKCRHEFGLVGGTAVSNIKGNLVDLENDLRNQTRSASLCSSKKYAPSNSNFIQLENGQKIDTSLQHLQPCQMIRYHPIPLPPVQNYNSCPPVQLRK